MPLRKQLIEAPLSSGLNQKSDVRSLVVDGAVTMQNCVRAKNGAIRKRPGTTQLDTNLHGPNFTLAAFNCVRGLNYGKSPLILDGYTLSQYSDSLNQWHLLDSVPEAVAAQRFPVVSGPTITNVSPNIPPQGDIDYCAALNYYVVVNLFPVAINTIYINASVIDATSGAVVMPSTSIDTSGNVGIPRLAICGTNAIVVYARPTGLFISRLDLTNIAAGWSAPSNFDNTASVTLGISYDISPMVGDITRFAVGYFRAANTVVYRTANATTLAPINTFTKTQATSGASNSMAVNAVSGQWCWIAYSVQPTGTTQVYETWAFNDSGGATINPIGAFTTASTPISSGHIGIAHINSTDAVIFYEIYESSGPPYLMNTKGQQVTSNSSGTTVGPIKNIPNMQLYSKPVAVTTHYGTRWYALMNVPSSLQGTLALVCFDWAGLGAVFANGGRMVTTIAPRLVKSLGGSAGDSGYGGVFAVSKLSMPTATTIAGLALISSGKSRAGLYVQTFDFDSKNRFYGDVLSGSSTLGMGAGCPSTFDGQTIAEMGFIMYPEAITTTTQAGSNTGAYSYLITYEWVNANGSIERSATSPPINITLSSQSAILKLPTLGLTWRQRVTATFVNPANLNGNSQLQNVSQVVKICIYRTLAGGTTYYFVNSVFNDPTVSSISYTDTAIDSILTSQAQLVYTTGGVLDNFCPPSAKICIAHKNRWFLAGCDDPTAIWPSKAFTFGETPGFNEQMNFNATGAVTALASLDEKLIIFVQRGAAYGIEYIVGDGPFDTGAGDNWTNPPQPIPSAAGALDQRGIAVCELGVFFFSAIGGPSGQGGVFLLSRDLQVHYVSGAVEDLIAANPICTAAVVHPSLGRVYFEFATTDTIGSSTPGIRLVYDYLQECWSSDTHYGWQVSRDLVAARTSFVAGGQALNALGQIMNQPVVYWSDYAGGIMRENFGLALIDSNIDRAFNGSKRWVTATFQSAWFKPALSGFARFWRVQLQSDVLEAAQLTATFTFDYAPASVYSESMAFTESQIASFDRFPQCDIEHLVGNQKAKAIQVTLVDAPPAGAYTSGQGFSWASLTLEVGVEDGGRYQNLPAGQRG